MIHIITSTLKADRTLKSGAVLPAGSSIVTGVRRFSCTPAEFSELENRLTAELDSIVGRLARLKKGDSAKISLVSSRDALRKRLKEHATGQVIRGLEFAALLSGVHPSPLDRSERGFLVQSLKGLTIAEALEASASA